MGVMPKKPVDRIQYVEGHLPPFTANAVAIGLSTTEVTDLGTRTAAARAAWDAHQLAQQAAKNATAEFRNALTAMDVAAAAAVKKIKAKAEVTGNPAVYTLAQIPAPANPTPMGPLGKPRDFDVALDTTTGALTLKFKNTNPKGATGVVYQVWRRLGATGDFAYLGGVGEKKYVDAAVPAGTACVQYQIQAVRSSSVGPFALCNVTLGAGGGGTSVVEGTPAKLAA
jgi:hypothetical protein